MYKGTCFLSFTVKIEYVNQLSINTYRMKDFYNVNEGVIVIVAVAVVLIVACKLLMNVEFKK